MASLNPTYRVGNTSASSLIKSASSAATAVQDYNDKLAAAIYENSAKTNDDFNTYSTYLNGRIGTLSTSTSIADASKLLTLSQTLTSAAKSNTSAEIQRENIQVLAGNANLSDKYNVIVNQYQRAVANNDLGLAQSLESQAYSVSQSIQYQAQQAASAASTLASASTKLAIDKQSDIGTSLDNSLKQLNNDIQHTGVATANTVTNQWVSQNAEALQSLGVVVPKGAQPNYFDLVSGIATAKYNALVLKAQAQAPTDPFGAQNTLEAANNIRTGVTSLTTLGGNMTFQDLQDAAQNPAEFAYDNSTGKYTKTQQTGFSGYNANGDPLPTFSGQATQPGKNILLLNPNQTAELQGLGLNFSMNKAKNGDATGTTGDGVKVQSTENSPQWLKDIVGDNGITNAFTDAKGNIQFKGADTSGTGGSAYYTLTSVGGLSGVFEHQQDGSLRLAGGDYGFNAGAASLLVNQAVQKQNQIAVQTAAERASQQATLAMAVPTTVQQLSVTPPSNPSPVAQTVNPQATATSSILQNASPQSTQILQPAGQVHSNVQGVPLKTTGGPSIKL